jgi:uncharacterized protein YaaN involved in tellurite resistance
MSTNNKPTDGTSELSLNVDSIKQQLSVSTNPTSTTTSGELETQANDYVTSLIAIDSGDLENQHSARLAVEISGKELQQESSRRSAMLKEPIADLAKASDDGGPVAQALIDLKMQVENLDPARFDFSAGWFTRLLGFLPGVGTPLKRYFTKFESAQTVIDAIIASLEVGKRQLERDNITLSEDQKAMRELTYKLEQQIALSQLIDSKLQYQLDRELTTEDARREFIETELLFPLRQRVMDLQQQLAVNQQGVLAIAVLVNNNRELIRGVDRALSVTVNALQVAVTVAMGLAHQKIVLDKVTALNKTTSDLIANTAANLKNQGAAIQQQAGEAMLDMGSLKQAFADISQAMSDISTFRQEALPQMAETILEFNKMAMEGESAIKKMEEAETARPLIDISPA